MSYEKIYLSLDDLYGVHWIFLDKDDVHTALQITKHMLEQIERSLTNKNTAVLNQAQFDVLNVILDEELLTPFDEYVKNKEESIKNYDQKHLEELVRKSKSHKKLKAALNNIMTTK